MNRLDSISYAEAYNGCFAHYQKDLEYLATVVSRCPDGDLVEFGAGSGRVLQRAWNRRWILVEQDPEMLALLDKSVPNFAHKDFLVIRDTVMAGKVASASAGLIFLSTNSLAEMQPLRSVFAEAFRILVPGGRLIAFNENPKLWPRLQTSKWIPQNLFGEAIEFFVETKPLLGTANEIATKGFDRFETIFSLRRTQDKKIFRSFQVPQVLATYDHLLAIARDINFSQSIISSGFAGEPFVEADSLTFILELIK